ncbi:MAG: transglutaminase domain-containing protein [Paludibacter sp.]|nr:transglutaminase domain-containing protein [Paludibacter sp.]
MKQFVLSIIILFNIGNACATDFDKIDKQSESVPANLKTATEIAHYLTRNLSNPTDKTRAIFYWITQNIKYDVAGMNSYKTYSNTQELVDEVLKKRKGVCSNYSALFQALCQSIGIQSYIIDGYIRLNGKLMLEGHSWNAVYIANHFYDIDVTWSSGFVSGNKFKQQFSDKYFMVQPSEFIKTHMPTDPIWQFSTNPITFKDFDTNNFQKLNYTSNFNFVDSIRSISTLTTQENLSRKKLRVIHLGITNSFIKEELINLTNEIEDEELLAVTKKFNHGVEIYNNSILIYNKYVLNREKDNTISSTNIEKNLNLLTSSRSQLDMSLNILNEIKTRNRKLYAKITTLKNQINREHNIIDNEISTMRKSLNN